MGVISDLINGVSYGYDNLTSTLSPQYASLVNLLVFSILICLYAIFTWKFYRNLSKKDLIQLDLARYNRSTHPRAKKFLASVLYFIEYLVILPFLVFFWIAVLAIIMLALSQEQLASRVLIISAAIVAAIRILSYYQEDLSRDLAKMFPFTILAIYITSPNFFSFSKLLNGLVDAKDFLPNVTYFFVFIICLEFVLRIIDTITHYSERVAAEK